MHPFGGTPTCPRCSKSVYAAEQACIFIMGPGRKPCLACTTCHKRLDSLTLLEHDQLVKICHIRTFGIRDLRHANLPHRDDLSPHLPTSPLGSTSELVVNTPTGSTTPARTLFPTSFIHNRTYGSADLTSPSIPNTGSHSPVRAQFTGGSGSTPLLRANATLPARFNRTSASTPPPELITSETEEGFEEARAEGNEGSESNSVVLEANTTTIGRGGGFQFPRTIPADSSGFTSGIPGVPGESNNGLPIERPPSPLKPISTGLMMTGSLSPLKQTSTGTRYGLTLGGVSTSPVKSWGLGGATPACPRCGKNVYFAEQIKAVGKVWHKGCLRCTSCNAFLDSKRLNEKDGEPFCGRCYSKLYGPQGSGYALLGKAGG
ncbi:hypothetical protein V8B97DRAFT_1904451 [Scleroderma yunnanense]